MAFETLFILKLIHFHALATWKSTEKLRNLNRLSDMKTNEYINLEEEPLIPRVTAFCSLELQLVAHYMALVQLIPPFCSSIYEAEFFHVHGIKALHS